ncbi:hypothetical protein AB1A81_04335 [Bdellovibrio bacteriovorus]|uniref:Uncharacterized protein n=1 Tax=Bdellovibrio bacteriovorus (strain ATCC 15356 / DSM 50701 / NCIMB 9529 / HD100) TaxID=264462 RepID=Q6MPC0_BDEBA|nr:hypothetical protein [Bdellovibrio bacteriovorus]AHZ86193.1 hypothetical protein EP01_14810 [Bdellovibrio bacteriovorus]BEV67429.1 hypothetical protein Bb109J_c0849 [Bdellovibrio bacteriovorus]CAE78878.1 hypothetical protein predicted by Glimmer/Critica [Bdellovibrio bacteriovorus HD100]
METNELRLLKLQTELKSFGLNPAEWSLQKIQVLGYLLQNTQDEKFAMYGRLEYRDKKPRWKSLEVVSL